MQKLEKIFSEGAISLSSPEEMRQLGTRIAAALEGGECLGLVGDLGAGKTHLVQGILEGLGASSPGASPTFTLVHEHHDGRLPAAHFDFYRLNSPQEAEALGWHEFCYGPLSDSQILLVEWADRFDGTLMPDHTLWLRLEHAGENLRRVHCPSLN